VLAYWQKDDKVWLEPRPRTSTSRSSSRPSSTGIGERGFSAADAYDDGIVEFRRIHNQVQMIY
jgi:hypothetical protein